MKSIVMTSLAVVALIGCAEKPQELSSVKQDVAPFNGTGKPYAEKTFKQGDKASWESALRARTQNGQNDYTKTN
jgi:hypothetical protein